jgi:hypothetical protein
MNKKHPVKQMDNKKSSEGKEWGGELVVLVFSLTFLTIDRQ